MSTLNPETIANHYKRPLSLFPDAELCRILTNGVSQKKFSDVTQEDVRDGLREANWSVNLLKFMCKDPQQGGVMLSRYLGRIKELSKNKIAERLLAHLVRGSMRPEFASKISAQAKEDIKTAGDSFPGVASRIERVQKRKKNFDILLPASDKYKDLRSYLFSQDEEISPKKLDKLIFEVKDPAQRKIFLNQYLAALKSHLENKLAKKLLRHLRKHLKHYDRTYRGELDKPMQDLCETAIADIGVVKQSGSHT